MSNQESSSTVDDAQYLAESTLRIRELHEIEQKLVHLVETAGDAIGLLAGVDDNESEESIQKRSSNFRELAARYFSLVNDIQLSLRSNAQYLAKADSTPPGANRSIPFRASIATEQTELEVWTMAVQTIQQRVEHLKRLAQE
ncbi:hypothetical protein VTP01DRAFT_4096 [Rhizomucor pusillus]|uniref:uncharacterized protein n=1 Tax=Rhizomucor pusillus TaxID=4840 RepID=UPI003742093F